MKIFLLMTRSEDQENTSVGAHTQEGAGHKRGERSGRKASGRGARE